MTGDVQRRVAEVHDTPARNLLDEHDGFCCPEGDAHDMTWDQARKHHETAAAEIVLPGDLLTPEDRAELQGGLDALARDRVQRNASGQDVTLGRVAEVLARHADIEWMGAPLMEHRCTECHAVVLGEAAPDFTAFGGRTVGQCALAAHQAAVLAAEGLLADAGWWEGVNDQWKHRPMGHRLLETANPYAPPAELAETDTTEAEFDQAWAAGEEP